MKKSIPERKQFEKALLESEERFQLLFNKAPLGYQSLDIDGNFIEVNQTWLDALGYTRKEVIGKWFGDFLSPDYQDGFRKQFPIFKAQGKIHSEFEMVHKNGNKLFISFEGNIGYDLSGEFKQTHCILEDITERKKAEEELHNSYIFSELLLKTIPFGMDIVDETGTVLFQSEQFKNIFGKSAIGKKCWELYRDDKKQCSDCPLVKGITLGETGTLESHGVIGGRIYEIFHTGMVYEGKKALLEIFLDITDKKRTESDLIKAKETAEENGVRFRNLFENSPIGKSMTGIDGSLHVNKSFCEIVGYSEKELNGQKWKEISYPEDISLANEKLQLLLNGEAEKVFFEKRYIHKNGNIVWADLSVYLQRNKENKPEWFITTITDITARKNYEKELIKAKEKAEESDHLKSAFLTNMSHEVRTPMNGILGFTELLKDPNLSSDNLKDYIQTIQISGVRMLNTINSIVDISKIESGLVTADINGTDINDKMEFTYKFFKPEVELKGLKFSFNTSLPSKEAIIETDNEKVYGILTNLVRNAIKFTFEGSIEFGYVLKSGSEPGSTEPGRSDELEFYVKDTGVGISQSQQQIIFERFRQGSESHNRGYEGSGLGLSIAKSYVEMLGGKIWVESEEGLGSVFYFTIPYNVVLEEETETISEYSSENKKIQLKKLKILIVEDDEISCSLLTRMLQNISKEVLYAITGVEAIEACRNNPDLDLVLMDIRMPRMDGLEATRQIRQFNKNVIIIAQTAFAFTGDKEKAIEAGCNDYISKPINQTLLNKLIIKHINK